VKGELACLLESSLIRGCVRGIEVSGNHFVRTLQLGIERKHFLFTKEL
jgi:hypothetical protein